jgi:hypothetical protein
MRSSVRRLYPSVVAAALRPEPDCTWIHRERHRPGVTLELLHHEYLEQHPDGLRYTTFCDRYRAWLGRRGPVMRQVHIAGDKAFVDYSGKKARVSFARATPRLRINAIEPGFTPATNLGRRDLDVVVRALAAVLVPLVVAVLLPFVKILSTPRRSARVLTRLLTAPSGPTGIYFDERGEPMTGSAELRDPAFQDRVVRETRSFLAGHAA